MNSSEIWGVWLQTWGEHLDQPRAELESGDQIKIIRRLPAEMLDILDQLVIHGLELFQLLLL